MKSIIYFTLSKKSLLLSMRLLLLTLTICLSATINAQKANKISESFESGDAEAMAGFFHQSVDMNLPDNNGIYQKEQAKMLLEKFFSDNIPSSFEIKHEGGSKQKSKFQIGKLNTENGSFRTYLLYNSKDDVLQIIELRIEEQ